MRLYTELDNAAHAKYSLEQIQRMENLIQSLLRLERLCTDGYAFHFESAAAETIIREQWQNLQAIWPNKKLVIEGSAQIRCDENWLGEAFLNCFSGFTERSIRIKTAQALAWPLSRKSSSGTMAVSLQRTESMD